MRPDAQVSVDYGPDWPEEAALKEQLAALQKAYQREAEPLLKRLAEIHAIKTPKMFILPEAESPNLTATPLIAPTWRLSHKDYMRKRRSKGNEAWK